MIGFFVIAKNVHAQIVIPRFQNPDTNIGDLVKTLYQIAIGLVGFAVFIQFVHAGFTYFLAAGNVGETHKGKEIMQNAVLGAVLLLAAWLILNVINPDLVRTDLFSFPNLTSDSPISKYDSIFPELGKDNTVTGRKGAEAGDVANANTKRELARIAATCACPVYRLTITDDPTSQEVMILDNPGIYGYLSDLPVNSIPANPSATPPTPITYHWYDDRAKINYYGTSMSGDSDTIKIIIPK